MPYLEEDILQGLQVKNRFFIPSVLNKSISLSAVSLQLLAKCTIKTRIGIAWKLFPNHKHVQMSEEIAYCLPG